MQFPGDCTRTRSPPPPLRSLSPLSLALCLAGFSPGRAQSRSGPVGTFYSTTSVTFCRSDWASISWAWTCTTAAVSSRISTSMFGWVFNREEKVILAREQQPSSIFVGLVLPRLFRNCAWIQQQSPASGSQPRSHFFEEIHSQETHH